jgi:hypothetical protein
VDVVLYILAFPGGSKPSHCGEVGVTVVALCRATYSLPAR